MMEHFCTLSDQLSMLLIHMDTARCDNLLVFLKRTFFFLFKLLIYLINIYIFYFLQIILPSWYFAEFINLFSRRKNKSKMLKHILSSCLM